ncbi:60Kd inner membrane protein-domain-containing protein [Cladorrhinum sp. PSN332]|nr:60Kd inner membrane protein-domain-containing protein [Cladorrhinum sp. PSN332]
MTATALRSLTRLRGSQSPGGVVLSSARSTFTPARRSYSSSLRPSSFLAHPTRPRLGSKHVVAIDPKRPFSFSAAVDTAIIHTEHALCFIHTSTGTPWYISIPLFALAFTILKVPMTIYNTKRRQKMEKLVPLLRATQVASNDSLHARLPHAGLIGLTKHHQLQKKTRQQVIARFLRDWGTQRWKIFAGTLLPFPFWLLGIEAIRRHCGGPGGLLSLFSWGMKSDEAQAAAKAAAESTTLGAGQIQDVVVQGFDPSMLTGGCLWFTDLTAADPYGVLPFALSAVIVLHNRPRTPNDRALLFGNRANDKKLGRHTRWQVVIARGTLLFGMVIGPVTMSLPSAMHLYWLSTSLLNQLQTNLVAKALDTTARPEHRPQWTGSRGDLMIRPTREEYPSQKS